jgi:hypothetical protein
VTRLGSGYCSNCKEHESSPKFCQYCEIHTLRWRDRQKDVPSILDHYAYTCECGSVHFHILKSGQVECSGCGKQEDLCVKRF